MTGKTPSVTVIVRKFARATRRSLACYYHELDQTNVDNDIEIK